MIESAITAVNTTRPPNRSVSIPSGIRPRLPRRTGTATAILFSTAVRCICLLKIGIIVMLLSPRAWAWFGGTVVYFFNNGLGGAPGSYVIISGTSASGSVSGGYTCYAPQSAGTFTVPSYILASLPAGSGTTTVQNSTNLGAFSASGLDFGATLGNVAFTVNSTFN